MAWSDLGVFTDWPIEACLLGRCHGNAHLVLLINGRHSEEEDVSWEETDEDGL